MSNPIRLVVADDHQIFLDGLVLLFQRLSWVDLRGSASDGDALLDLIAKEQPAIALIDLSMPGASTETIIETVEQHFPHTRLMALTMLNDANRANQLLALGLAAYVVKDNAFEDLLDAIAEVAAGGQFISPCLVEAVRQLQHSATTIRLTDREQQILTHVAQGDGNKQIAYKLGISERTVCFHLANCFMKLGVSNRTQAVTCAINHAVIQTHTPYSE